MTAAVDARRLADLRALYRMFDGHGHLLYIGITGDLGKRLGDHSFKRWFPLVERITLEWLPNQAAATLAERRAISAERPRYNRSVIPPPPLPKKAARPAPRKPELPARPPRKLLDDLDEVLGDTRIKLRDAIGLLRGLAPEWQPYQKMTAVRLRDELKLKGVRTVNTSGTHYLDPADLRQGRQRSAA